MRICRVSRSFPPVVGGLERHVELLSRHQARRGDDVWVLQPLDQGVLESGLTLVRVRLGPLSRWIYAGRSATKLATAVFAARSAVVAHQLHRQRPFDLLHVHGDIIEVLIHMGWGWAGEIPVILTLHSGLNRRPLYRWLAAGLFRFVDGFIAVSLETREDLLNVGVDAGRIAVIPSGLDTDTFRPPSAEERQAARAALRLRDDETAIVSVGRSHPVKGHDVLIRSVAALGSARVFMVGDGPEEGRLRRQARDLPNIEFVGHVDHPAIVRYLHAADIFVLPSVDLPGVREGTPTALLEAMACRLPVVCTDAGGLRHLVRDNENGLMVSQGDSAGLAAALSQLLSRPQLGRLFGERNAAFARAREWRNVTEQVAAFYEQIRHLKRMRVSAEAWNR